MEILALLNPHAKDLRMLPPHTKDLRMLSTGFQNLTAYDISHAISFIKTKGPRLVGRYKYAEQLTFKNSLDKELLIQLRKTAKANRWKNIESLQRLAEIAVQLYCHPQRCDRCGGIGERMWGARKIVCPKCNGSSWNRVNDQEIARFIGVDGSSYYKTHRERLGVAIQILTDWDRICCATIRKTMR